MTSDSIDTILEKINQKESKKKSENEILLEIEKEIVRNFEKKAILGFDIYRYSQYPLLRQSIIPHLFKTLYYHTIYHCLKHEPYIFQNMKEEDFINHFIDTGDGGFQIFDTPFHAIIFALYFQANIKRYNANKETELEDMRRIVGEITLRYSITFDSVYSYENNYYGPAIITNSRIMSKDRLNRCLIDENTNCWFTEVFQGIENLQAIGLNDIAKLELFKNYKASLEKKPSIFFSGKECKILCVHVLKIGEITSKHNIISVHSLHIQTQMISKAPVGIPKFTISLGNINSSGIVD